MLLQMTNPVPVFFAVNIDSKILSKYSSSYGLSIFTTNLNIKLFFQPKKIVYAISQKKCIAIARLIKNKIIAQVVYVFHLMN